MTQPHSLQSVFCDQFCALQISAMLLSRNLPPFTKSKATHPLSKGGRNLLEDSCTICILALFASNGRILKRRPHKLLVERNRTFSDEPSTNRVDPQVLKLHPSEYNAFASLQSAICNVHSPSSLPSGDAAVDGSSEPLRKLPKFEEPPKDPDGGAVGA